MVVAMTPGGRSPSPQREKGIAMKPRPVTHSPDESVQRVRYIAWLARYSPALSVVVLTILGGCLDLTIVLGGGHVSPTLDQLENTTAAVLALILNRPRPCRPHDQLPVNREEAGGGPAATSSRPGEPTLARSTEAEIV
jgi:hypothetical protein